MKLPKWGKLGDNSSKKMQKDVVPRKSADMVRVPNMTARGSNLSTGNDASENQQLRTAVK